MSDEFEYITSKFMGKEEMDFNDTMDTIQEHQETEEDHMYDKLDQFRKAISFLFYIKKEYKTLEKFLKATDKQKSKMKFCLYHLNILFDNIV